MKKITILFDANPMATGHKSGIGYYTHYLIQSLADQYPDRLSLVGQYYNFLGRKHELDLPHAPNISYRQSRLWPGKATNLLRRLGLQIPFEILAKHRGDVLLFPNYLSLPSLFGKPVVSVVHDLSFIAHPDFIANRNLSDLRRLLPGSIARSKLVITISDFTRGELKSHFGLVPNKVLVTPIPPLTTERLNKVKGKEVVRALGIDNKYLLFVGNLEPRKNLASLVEAYTKLDDDLRRDYSLVIAGGHGWKNEKLLARIKKFQADGLSLVTPGYVTDEQKIALYQNASAVVLPSFYEGFGMPVLEAYSYNVPTAVSDIPVLREVAGAGALYFDPNDKTDIARTLTSLLKDASVRKKLMAHQPTELVKYSWQANAKRVFDQLQKLTENS